MYRHVPTNMPNLLDEQKKSSNYDKNGRWPFCAPVLVQTRLKTISLVRLMVLSRNDTELKPASCIFFNPRNGWIGRHGSWKVTHWLHVGAWPFYSRLIRDYLFVRPQPKSQKNMRETRDLYFLKPPCLPVEPFGGLNFEPYKSRNNAQWKKLSD